MFLQGRETADESIILLEELFKKQGNFYYLVGIIIITSLRIL